MKWNRILIGAILAVAGLALSCTPEEGSNGKSADNFDRAAMLSHWADNFIVPAYEQYHGSLQVMQSAADQYVNNPTVQNHDALHRAFSEAYKNWQYASIFEIGPAETARLRNYTNVYPTDSGGIEDNIHNGSTNLELPSTFDEQGLPAIDYLLSGLGDISTTNAAFANNAGYGQYLLKLANRLEGLTQQVLKAWQEGYRNTFVENDGSSATASANKLINDYVYFYEKELRAGKIGIPAGVFSGGVLPTAVEAYYTDSLSLSLFLTALDASKMFFEGATLNGVESGPSLYQYLNYLETEREGRALADVIVDQFGVARTEAMQLNPSFRSVLAMNRQPMLETYDVLQVNVVFLKVDMLQALNVRVDYIDADGD